MNPRLLGVVATLATGAIIGGWRAFDLGGATAWFNSKPLTVQSLRGKVVLVDIWTYSCINSLRQFPYVMRWAAKYKDAGLVVIGVHTPEFPFEHDHANVAWAIDNFHVTYPVPMDNDYAIWRSLDNEYWPADYLMDGQGRVRYTHFGEGNYAESERMIQQLLKENGATNVPGGTVTITETDIEAPPSQSIESPETYIGSRRAEHRVDPLPATLGLNEWGLAGSWNVGAQSAVLDRLPGAIVFRFHARDLHLVMGSSIGKPVRFRVTLDGAQPGEAHGVDVAPDGTGVIRQARLYQLIRQPGRVQDRTFRIEFLDPYAEAYVFTFG
ncbi:MAG TPA: redoxin family protein [Gemmatimonadaceae bacterium]|nr:redoxin family protein [Gemmatimonadaceae bacterium]